MSLVRYEPFNILSQFQKELNRLGNWSYEGQEASDDSSDVAVSHWRPAVDIKEENNRFVILADLPGVDPKEIEITMDNGVLTIKGERSSEQRQEEDGFKRVERVRGTFYRRFSLPDTADADGIEASGKDGVLEISVPKHEKLKPRRIAVSH